jgi:hypothetical protein
MNFTVSYGYNFSLKTAMHNIQSGIKQTTCFSLLSQYQALIKNTNKTLNTVIYARSTRKGGDFAPVAVLCLFNVLYMGQIMA